MDENIIYLIIAIGIILLSLYLLYINYDGINQKKSRTKMNYPDPQPEDSNQVYIEKIRNLVRMNCDCPVIYTSIIVGLIAVLVVVYVLQERLPRLSEWLVLGLLIIGLVYMSNAWCQSHFLHPNSQVIERGLFFLQERI